MVGVARIELATPAMSTQSLSSKLPKYRIFWHRDEETDQKQYNIMLKIYPTFTQAILIHSYVHCQPRAAE
jgi:hypothetical protein